MGTTETYFGDKPTANAINRHIDDELSGPRATIIGRSGLQNWNGKRWTIVENTSGDKAGSIRGAVLTTIYFSRGYLGTRHQDESMGPYDYSIPERLLKMLDEHPPVNEYAARWRRECRKSHRQEREANRLLKRLQHAYQQGLNPQVAIGERTGTYHHVRSRNKWHHTYTAADRRGYIRINRNLLNVEETRRMLEMLAASVGIEL